MFRVALFGSHRRLAPRPSLVCVPRQTCQWRAAATATDNPQHLQQQQQQLTREQQLLRVRATAVKLAAYANLHRSNVNMDKTRIALQAWREVQELPEHFIEQAADIDAVVKLLNAFAYFRSHWENGHDGPSAPLPVRSGAAAAAAAAKADPNEIEIPADFYGTTRKASAPDGSQSSQQPRRFTSRPKPVEVIGEMIE